VVLKTLENKAFCRKTGTPPASGAAGVEKRKPMMIPDLELPACLHGIVAKAESARDRLEVASVSGALHAMEHIHDRRPQGLLGMAGICRYGFHVR
jgi:hypothetical protein